MGMFFEKVPDPAVMSTLAEAFQEAPPATDAERDQRVTELLGRLPMAQALRDALSAAPVAADQAQVKASASTAALAVATPMKSQFNGLRFFIALLLFGALVGAGAACDAEHLTASAAALFSFGGSVFGVVTAFLGTEKGS
jgi:hypothetical protein